MPPALLLSGLGGARGGRSRGVGSEGRAKGEGDDQGEGGRQGVVREQVAGMIPVAFPAAMREVCWRGRSQGSARRAAAESSMSIAADNSTSGAWNAPYN